MAGRHCIDLIVLVALTSALFATVCSGTVVDALVTSFPIDPDPSSEGGHSDGGCHHVRHTRVVRNQNNPSISPISSMSIRIAAGSAGSPGIVSTSPVSATMNPAPTDG